METETIHSRVNPPTLNPLPYHARVRDFLKKEEAELWSWFSSNKVREQHAEKVRLDLLKSTYRIEATTQPQLYGLAEEVLSKLELRIPVSFYQTQSLGGMNAALAFLPGEGHIILFGSILDSFSATELKAIIGHELAHFLLFDGWNGENLVVAEILQALSNDVSAQPCHRETSRLFSLYQREIFADRRSICVQRGRNGRHRDPGQGGGRS